MSGSAGSTLTPEEIDALTPETTARPERYLPTLSEEEIDRLQPGEISPEQIDRLEPTYGRPVADLQQTTRGGPRRELPSAGEAFASFRQELPEGLPSVRSAGPAFAYAGNVARAVPADVAALAYPEAGGNIQAALTQPVGNRLPIDTAIDAAKAEEQERPWYRKTSTLATVSQGLARTAPKIAAIGATGAVATAAGAGTAGTLLSEMFTAGGLFGLDEEGNFHPKEAAIGAALPGIGSATRLAVAKSIGTVLKNGDLFGSKSAAELLAQPVAQKVVETAGEQASLNAFTVAMDMPRLTQLYHDNPKEFQGELAEMIGSNLAFGLLGVRKVADSRIPSETQRWIVRNAEALSKKQVLQSIAPGTLAEIWNSDPATASPEVNDIRRMIFENLDPATADQAFQKGVLVIGQEWPRLLAKAIGVMPQTVDVIPSAVPITGGRRRALLPTTTGEANAIDTEQQQGGVQPERERIDAERQASAEAGGGDRVPGATGQPPIIQTGGQGGGQGAAGQNLPAGETVPAPPAKPALTLKPDMATAKAVFHMTPEEFRVAFPTGGFNHINLPLGQNVTDAELEKLRQFAGYQQTAMADAFEKAQKSKTDADMQTSMDEAHKLQFFNEAIAEAEKKRATGQPTASAGHTEPNPSPAQIEAGNAPKRTIRLHGLDISIENEKGGIRRSKPGAKQPWEVTMPAAYGYIKGTVGKDKDHIDAYVGDNQASGLVVVIDQMNPDTKAFDEHKVMLGFDKVADAVKTYERAFSDGKGSDRILDVNAVVMSEFKKWLKEGDHKKPFGDWLSEAKPATKPAVRKAGDLEGLTEAELDAMLDEAAKPVAKAAVPPKPERPAHILALEKEVSAGKGDEPYLLGGGRPLGISKKQYLEMSGLSTYDQTEKFGYSIADLMEKLTTGTMPRPRRAPAAKPTKAVKPKSTSQAQATASLVRVRQLVNTLRTNEDKHMIEGAYISLRGHAEKLGIEAPRMGTYFSIEEYRKAADTVEKAVAAKYGGGQPTAEQPTTKTAAQIAADAAKAGVKGVDEAMQGLHKLFGGGKHLGAGPTFDEKTYQEAKPHFESAWEQFRKAGKSLADFLRFILDKFGVGVRAYIKRFIQEKQAGLQKTVQPPTVPADVNRPTEGPSGGGGVGGAIPATPGATGQGGQAAAPPARPGGEVQPAGGPPDEGTAGAPGRPSGGAAVPDADRVPTGGTPGGQGTPERPTVGGGGEGAATVPGQPAAAARPVVSPPLGEPETTLPTETAPPQPKNLRLTENPAPTGAVARVNANIAAIELVKDLGKRGVFPTDAERAILAQWSGWGSFKELFNEGRAERREYDAGWMKRYGKAYDKLKKLLTDAEFLAAAESSVNAHYTSPEAINGMWTLARRLGFKGGRVLESAVGRGDFIGFSPADLNLRWTMVELEPITARIAGYLYPEADLRMGGFEDAKLPRGYYDLNITNVPFFETGPGREYPTMNLHNYFIARGLDMLKPGGLLLVISSKGTMDAKFDQRQILAGKGQLIGAIRLPSNAFKESAATEVVTDIIAIRKPDGKPFDQAQDWLNTVSIDVKGTPYNINEYYAKHPDMVLGRHAMTGTMYRGESYNVESTGGEIGPKMAAAIAKFPENVIQIERAAKPAAEEIAAGGMTSLEDYSLSLNAKGQVVEARNFQLERPSWDTGNDTLRKRAKQYVQLRDVLRAQYGLERDKDATDAAIDANRKKLQAAYLAWTKANGTLNLNARKNDFLSSDSGYYTVLGLENVTQEADPKDASKARTVIKPADVLSVRTLMPDRPPEKVESAADALAVSLSYSGVLDLAYIKQLTGLTDEQIESDLIGANLAYKDPESGQLQTVADYLTGDVRDKLAKAMFAAKDNAAFERNVEALKSVIPDTVPFDRVSVDITARWTPVPVLNKFAVQELGLPENIVGFTPVIEEFSVRAIERISDRARTEWSTAKMAAPELLRHALNFKRALIREWDPVDEKYVKDEAGTALANQMIDAIKKRYAEWIRQTDHTTAYRFFDSKIGQYRTEEMPIWEVMEREFNRVSNSFVVPENDGSKLTLPGLSTMVRRTQHLLNGVQRGINEGHAVFAHGVGSGKTFMGIVLGHELQRVGLARKFLHVVKKPTVDQYRVSLQRAYPGSKVLIPSKKDFDRENRQKLLSRIASGRWDAVVLTHEQFKSISPGESMVNEFFDEQIQQLLQILREAGGSEADVDAKSTRNLDPSVRNIVRKIKSMRKRMDEHIASIRKRQDTIKWEDLNVDGVFIDESHAFKNMPLATNMENDVKGIPSDFSQRAVDLLVKVRDIQRRTNGRNVFFASGTPISNTLAELWVQFHATAPQMLKDLHVETFDSFASTFADVVTSFELGWDGKTFKDVTRMSRFKNPSGLTTLTRLGMDVKIGNKELGLDVPDVEGGKPEVVVIKPTAAFMRCAALVERIADMWDTLDPKGRYDNSWVPIATMRMGVAAALDPRLVLPDAEDDPNSKVNTSIGHIFEEWEKGKDRRTTMMVFADLFQTMSTAKLMAFIGGEKVDTSSAEIDVEGQDASNEEGDAGSSEEEARARGAIGKFNLYNDIRAKLVARGVPESEIAIITEHDTDAKRDDLFNKVRNGIVRILMGSTEKIGEGVDVPQRMSAQFHLDPPAQMTPAKLEQRLGRIIRQGNLHSPKNWNLPVRIKMYAQERSMDAGIYQKLETKSVGVLQALRGQYLGDTFEDPADDITLTVGTLKAAATGDKRSLLLGELTRDVRELNVEHGAFMRRQSELRRAVSEEERASQTDQRNADDNTKLAQMVDGIVADKEKVSIYHAFTQKRVTGEEAIKEWLKAARATLEEKLVEPDSTAEMHFLINDTLRLKFEAKRQSKLEFIEGTTERRKVAAELTGTGTFYIGGTDPTWRDPRYDSTMTSIESVWPVLLGIPKRAAEKAAKEVESGAKHQKLAGDYQKQIDGLRFDKMAELREKSAALDALQIELRGARAARQAARAAANPNGNANYQEWVKHGRPTDIDPQALAEYRAIDKPPTAGGGEVALSVEPGQPLPENMPDLRAEGLAELKELLNDPRARLGGDVVRLALAMLDQKVMRDLDWSRLRVELRNRIEGAGAVGTTNIGQSLIQLTRAASPTTFPHEVFHFLYEMLPSEDRDRVEEIRRQAIGAEVARWGGAMPSEVRDVLERLAQGAGISSTEFTRMLRSMKDEHPESAEWLLSVYHLINASEYLAGVGAGRFSKDTFNRTTYSWIRKLWERIKGWLQGLLDSLRRLRSVPPDIEQLIRELLAGKYRNSPTGGEAVDERRQFSVEPGDPDVPTRVFGQDDFVRGREQLTPSSSQEASDYAKDIFAKVGVPVVLLPAAPGARLGVWGIQPSGFDLNAEGRRLLQMLKKEIAAKNEPGKHGELLASLLNTIVWNFKAGRMDEFERPLREELYAVAQADRSQRGLQTGALAMHRSELDMVSQNLDVVLGRIWSDAYGGEDIRKLVTRVVEHFRDWFSDAEIEAALSSRPELREMVEKIIALNRRDEGGRVYRRVQQLLKPKMRKTLARLEGDARIEEAVEHILEQARRIGIEPKPNPNRKLPALQRLLLMVTPETAGKIDEAVAAAVQQAERNAGIKAALKAAGNDADREELQGRFDAGEEPEPEMVEEGLKLPEYAHWNWLRESILDYSPTTVKLAQDLIKQDFKGTRFGEQVQRPADTRIDLEKLAKQPDSAVRAGLDAYLQNLEANMDLAGATDETKQRVQVLVEAGVQEQLERARVRVRDPLFRERVARQPQTLTPEERAIAAVEQLLNAGLFADPRLNLPEMISRVAEKSKLRRLAPTINDLIKDVFATPFYRQSELSAGFANEMISRLGVPQEQADAARAVFDQVFAPQYEKARARALEQAKASMTPQERRVIKPGAALWVKIERMVNAGGFDGGQVLQEIARSKGWEIPTEQQVRHLRDLAEQEMRMRELTPQEQAVAGGDGRAIERALADRAAATLEKRAAIIKQMGTIWSRFSRPVNFRKPWATRKNIAAAANEFEVADMLLKVGFAFRLPTHILTQLLVHVPTRALGQAWINHQEELARGNPNSLIKEAALTLGSAMAGATKAIIPALNTAKAALAGRGEARNVDRLMSGIHLFERAEQRAQQYWDRGDYGRALFLRLMALPRFSLRFVQAVDNFQGVPAEYAQLRLQVRNALREQGRSPAEIDATIDRVLSGMKVKRDAAMGKAREILGPDAKEKEINEAAWHMVRSRIYEDLRDLGLEADDFRARNEKLRRTVAWQEQVMHGPGGIVASLGRGASTMLQEIGLPLSFVRFSNAIGTGINYMLMSTPAYALAGAKIPGISPNEPSPWFETEEDILQRRAQALLGSVIGALIVGLVLSGALVVRLFWPKDKEERELWEAGGHRPGTIEIRVGPHEFIPISMTVGPGSIIAPYAAAAGAVVDMFGAREKAQLKLNQEAQKRGLMPGKVRQPDMSDWLTVAGTAAWGTLLGNKAFAGVGQSVSEFGIPNSKKALAAYVSPLVPGLPAWQEMSRMMGVNLDSKLASFADYLVPLPTSGARAVNMLGEPVGTPDDVQRVFQSIFAGSYPWVVNEQAGVQKAPYAAMMASGYRPPSIDPGKGYAIAGQYRPLTDEELARYTVLRGENMAREFGSMGLGADQKSMQGAFQRANQAALEAVGVETPVSAGPTAGGYAATPRGVGAALSVAGGLGSPGRVSGQMRRVGARVRAGVRLPSPSRMAGAGRVRKAAAPRVRGAARPRATVGHHAGVRLPSLRRRP